MSNGTTENVTLENDVVIPVVQVVEELQESQESSNTSDQSNSTVVNCVQIDISERNSFQDDGEYSGHSSTAATPLERSQEVVQTETETNNVLLKEWNNSLINLLARIPVQAQKGLRTFDLKLTCIATISEEVLVIGTNVGIVYWYNRKTDLLDRLRCDGLNPITSLSCISTVDYMVAAGNQAGLVTIFQIPRDPSQDSASSKNNATPEAYYERKTKKSQQFVVQDMHKGAVTSLEWSRNGMKLFSGDQSGHVVLTDIDYDLVQIRSSILICENYEIVQLSYARKNLLICSTFRSIIYSLENKNFSKVGSLERKVTGKFGGLIVSSAWEESPKVYSVRPGARLWVANLTGVVQHTIKFKELILSGSQSEIHVIKPLRSPRQLTTPQEQDIQFTRIFRFMKDYLVTYYKDILHIIDARNTVVLGICKELRSILDIAVNKDEIFILESSRNVIRLSAKPDKFSNLTSSSFFANFSTSTNLMNNSASPTNSTTSSTNNNESGLKQTIPEIMSASIADFRFPQEPINFFTSKFKETSERVIPKINPIINTIKTVIEADVDIEDGQKLLESGIPSPVLVPSEYGDMSDFDIFSSPQHITPEEPVFVPEPERFQKISNLPFEDVVVEMKVTTRKTKKGSKSSSSKSKKSSATASEIASDTVSVSSAFSNTSGSENNMSTNGASGGTDGGLSSAASSASARKLSSGRSDVTFSSGSNSGSEGIMSTSEHPYMHHRDQLGVPLSLSQSWSVGTLLPNKTVTTEELHLKEELLARQLKWPELLPESVSADGLFDEPAVIVAAAPGRNGISEENNCWQVNLPRNNGNATDKDKRPDRSSVLTLVGPRRVSEGGSGDENTDTDSRTISLENGSSFGTVIEREVLRSMDSNSAEDTQKTTSGNCSTDDGDIDDDDCDDDKYYMDIYTRYRSKDSHSVSSFNSVLSFGPPSGSSHVSAGGAAALGVAIPNHHYLNGNVSSSSNNASLSSAYPETLSSDLQEDELCNSKEKSSDTSITAASSSTTTTEEADSIVEAKIVADEYWRKWRLPGCGITQLALCDKYIVCVSGKATVYYSSFDSISLHWKSTNYSASAISVSPCGSVIWRIYKGDLYSLTNPTESAAPIGDGGEQWSKLTQKKDVASATVHSSFGWIVKADGSLEFCTGLLQTRLVPYFEKVYTPWPIQQVTCCGHKLWALTSDGRVVVRTGTSDLNPKGIDWLEIRWSSNDIASVCSISCGDADGNSSVWFTDSNANLYFTLDERDSKGAWIPWKVAVSNSVMYPSQSSQQQSNCKSVLLSSLREQVSKSLKSLVPGTRGGLKLCSSKTSIWFATPEQSLLYGNRSTITGHFWKPIRVDRGITVPTNWVHIYANSVYHGHGILWISDSDGNIFYMPPSGGKLQQLDLPMFTDGRILAVAPAPEALWALTSSGDIHGRCGITTTNSVGKNWRQISLSTLNSTEFVHISCGSEVAWAVDDKGEVFMRVGSLRPPGTHDMSPPWNKVESSVCCKGVFTKVYVGANDSMVWALDNGKRVYVRQAVYPDYPIGTGWLLVKGVEAEMLSVSDSAVWALASNGSIYRRHGITKKNFVGDFWRKIPGDASAIAVSLCDELWALTSEGYLLKHSKKVMELKGWEAGNVDYERAASSPSSKIELDEEDEDWELVDNSEI